MIGDKLLLIKKYPVGFTLLISINHDPRKANSLGSFNLKKLSLVLRIGNLPLWRHATISSKIRITTWIVFYLIFADFKFFHNYIRHLKIDIKKIFNKRSVKGRAARSPTRLSSIFGPGRPLPTPVFNYW